MKRMKLQNIIMLPLFIILVVGILAQCIVVSVISSRTARELSTTIAEEATARYASDFDTMIAELHAIASNTGAMLDNLSSYEDGRSRAIGLMGEALHSNSLMTGIWTAWEPNAYDGRDSEFAGVDWYDQSGRFVPYLYKDGSSYGIMALPGYDDPVEGDYYQGAKTSKGTYVTQPYETDMGNEFVLVITITVPVMEGNTVKGALGIDFSLSGLADKLNAANVMDEGYLFSLSASGNFTSHPDSAYPMTNYKNSWMGSYSSQIESALNQGSSFLTTADTGSGDAILAGIPVSFGNSAVRMLVGGVIPMSTVNAKSTMLITVVTISGVLLLLAAVIPTTIILSRSLRDLPKMAEAAQLMSQGDIAAVECPSVTYEPTKNEITLLARSIVDLVGTTEKQVKAVQRLSDGDYSFTVETKGDRDLLNTALNTVLDSNNEVFAHIGTAAAQVSSASSQVAAGAQSLAMSSTEQAASVEQLSASIAQVLGQTQDNAKSALEALDTVNEAAELMQTSTVYMDQLRTAMDGISESSSNISKIIKTIEDIAFQTNILALNAAVEAARAGQHGKGFAVVAEEVRTLASKSANAAQETASLIQTSVNLVKNGEEITAKTGESMQRVATAAQKTQEKIISINTATQQQEDAITQINTGIEQISLVVQSNSATSEESAATSQEMSGQAVILTENISRFKLRDNAALAARSHAGYLPSGDQHDIHY